MLGAPRRWHVDLLANTSEVVEPAREFNVLMFQGYVVDFQAAKGYVQTATFPSGDAFAHGSGLISPTRIRYEAAPTSSIVDASANAR